MRVTLHLVFVLHRPVGTSDDDMESVAQTIFEPFLDLVEEHHEEVLCALHCSGFVLEWLDRHRRAVADRIAALAADGVIEMVGGGFYAPLLPIVPWRDGLGQLEMAAGYLERRMGARPSGVWLTDGVWEPRLAEMLADAGATWAMVPERILHDTSLPTPIWGHYSTEHLGSPLIVFPIDEWLGGTLATAPLSDVLEPLRHRATTVGCDCTLTWAGTPEQLGVERSRRLFEAISRATDWLTTAHPSASIERERPRGTAYMRPTTCMGRPLAQHHFIRYVEASWMHKRMIEVSRRFAAVERVMRNQGYKGLSKLSHPRRALFRGQAATIYEQGGTIYQPQVRDGVYRNLIAAEAETDELVRGPAPFLETSLRDLFGDFQTSALLRNKELRLVLQPHAGGTLAAFEHIPSRTALHNTMTRREEPWHARDEPSTELLDALDGHNRASLHDHFLWPDATVAQWLDDSGELSDLLHARYRMAGLNQSGRGSDERVVVAMTADGNLHIEGTTVGVSVIKRVGLAAQEAHATIAYEIELSEPLTRPIAFGCEFNWALLPWFGEVRLELGGQPTAVDLRAIGRADDALTAVMRHAGLGIVVYLHSSAPMTIEKAPVMTRDPNGHDMERTLQGVALLARRVIDAGETRLTWQMRLGVSALSGSEDHDNVAIKGLRAET